MLYSYPINKNRAAVQVKRVGRTNRFRVVEGSLCMINQGEVVSNLPDDWKIVDDNGEEIKPTGRFIISAETIDPYHLVVDMF